jgi:selenocysteine lyase/cysteine desulfurase
MQADRQASFSHTDDASLAPGPDWWRAELADGLVGEDAVVDGPFGPRPMVYADYTASGRAARLVEDAVTRAVLPVYGNTHTETSFTGRQTTALRELARRAVRTACGATDDHGVIFCGAGATAAIDKFGRVLGLHLPVDGPRPVVFVGPFEHHSNDLIWREWPVDLVRVPLGADGRPDMAVLASGLEAHADRPLRLVTMAAASNVTGVLCDMRALARLVHRHGGILACDYAAAGPYVPIRMAETAPGAGDGLDAVFLSPHKFPGGPGTSGVLVMARALARPGAVPSVPGGGTVAYVTADRQRYVADLERREEAGTPAIVANIRTGMALRLKELAGADWIAAREAEIVAETLADWGDHPAIEILGPRDVPRVAIFSFNIRAGDRYLHHNLVVALLNDLFGIQARGGCSCAGPYGHDLLGLDDARTARHEALVLAGDSLFRPGWARLGFTVFQPDATRAYIRDAVRFVADHGAALMRHYSVDGASGIWRATGRAPAPTCTDLADLMAPAPAAAPSAAPDFAACLAAARALAAAPAPVAPEVPQRLRDACVRWFWLPGE